MAGNGWTMGGSWGKGGRGHGFAGGWTKGWDGRGFLVTSSCFCWPGMKSIRTQSSSKKRRSWIRWLWTWERLFVWRETWDTGAAWNCKNYVINMTHKYSQLGNKCHAIFCQLVVRSTPCMSLVGCTTSYKKVAEKTWQLKRYPENINTFARWLTTVKVYIISGYLFILFSTWWECLSGITAPRLMTRQRQS